MILDQKKLLPCAAYLNGQYGLKNMYMGVPTIIGKKGIEKIIEVKLSAKEKLMLKKSNMKVEHWTLNSKIESGTWTLEVERWNWKLEVGRWKLNDWNWKLTD